MVSSIKTGLKFKRGTTKGNNGKLYAFVTKEGGHWKGCRENDERKKKIVFVDPSIAKTVIEGALYWCSIRPMKSNGGFIAISAEIAKFKANMEVIANGDSFKVIVKFGNKVIIYDPASKIEQRTDISGIANYLRHRNDLMNAQKAAEDFLDSACLVRGLYRRATCS